jgi:hypothetical protein
MTEPAWRNVLELCHNGKGKQQQAEENSFHEGIFLVAKRN